jgi:hypothetical protein
MCHNVSIGECRRMIQLQPNIWNKIMVTADYDEDYQCALIHDRLELARMAVESALAKKEWYTIRDIVGEYPSLITSRVEQILSTTHFSFYATAMWTYPNITRFLTSFKTVERMNSAIYDLKTIHHHHRNKDAIGFMAHLLREERTAATAMMLCRHSARGVLNPDCARHIKSFVYYVKPGILRDIIDRLTTPSHNNWFSADDWALMDTFNQAPYPILAHKRSRTTCEILAERADAARLSV